MALNDRLDFDKPKILISEYKRTTKGEKQLDLHLALLFYSTDMRRVGSIAGIPFPKREEARADDAGNQPSSNDNHGIVHGGSGDPILWINRRSNGVRISSLLHYYPYIARILYWFSRK